MIAAVAEAAIINDKRQYMKTTNTQKIHYPFRAPSQSNIAVYLKPNVPAHWRVLTGERIGACERASVLQQALERSERMTWNSPSSEPWWLRPATVPAKKADNCCCRSCYSCYCCCKRCYCCCYFLDAFSHLYKRVCPSLRPSVGHKRVEFLRNGRKSNKIASGTRKYII